MLEELTWAETRDLIKDGWTTVIIGTAGTEQKGPHMVDGEHKFVMTYTADKIARGIGRTLVAPVVTYVPEGSWETVGGHMGKPGTITLPEERFVDLLVNAGRSLKAGGFTKIVFLGESGGNRTGMRTAAEQLNTLWKGSATRLLGGRLLHQGASRSGSDGGEVPRRARGAGGQPRQHPRHFRTAVRGAAAHPPRSSVGNDYENNGVSGINQAKSSPEIGRQLLQIKMDLALAQYKRMPVAPSRPYRRPLRRGAVAAGWPRPPSGTARRTAAADGGDRTGGQDADERS